MAGYTRQSSADIIATAVVRANPLNVEYNALRDAFSASSGHKHDGTAAEGAYVPLIADSDALNKVVIDTTNNRVGVFVQVSNAAVEQIRIQDGAIVPVTNNDIDLGTSSLQFKNLYLDGTATIDILQVDESATITANLTVNGNTTLGNAATDTVTVTADVASPLLPSADDTYDLGAVGSEWRNLYVDGTANIDALVADTADINGGTVDGAVIGGASAAAGTFTSLNASGTATLATVDINAGNIDGTVIGAASAAAITGTTITGTSFVGDITGDVTGNADTATALATARTIGGVSFDGTANINLPGVNAAGNQDTSGTAADATILETARTIGGVSFDGSANINLPGVNTAGNQDTSGNAATATILATARTIAGNSFNGSANITIAATDLSDTDQSLATGDNVQFAQVTTTGNAIIGGNLTVNGTTTTVATTNMTVSDALIELGTGTTGTPANDAGIVIERGDAANAFMGYDESADKFTVGTGTFTGATTGNLSITTGTLVANVEGNVTGAVTGNADTATALATARTIAGQSFDGTGNISIAPTDLTGVNSTATELNIMDGDTSASATTLADADRVVVNDAGTMKQVALTDFETYFEGALDTLSNVTTVGALNSGTITSGFGAIDNGSSAITTTGTVTYGSLSDGTITITGFVDEDNMASNSATLIPTQQSVEARIQAVSGTANNVTGLTATGAELNTVADFSAVSVDTSTAIASNDALLVFDNGNEIGYRDVDLLDTYFSATTKTLTNKTLASPTVSGLYLSDSGFTVEGSGEDLNETTVAFTNPTADRTITFTDASGTVLLEGKANSIDSDMYVDGSIDQVHLADTIVNEAKMQISNAPTNGYVLTAQSGNTGGLTWAEAASGADLYTANESSPTANTVSGANSVAIGSNVTVSGANSFAAGVGATATAYSSFAFGDGADATGSHSVAIGGGAIQASGAQSIAIGYGSDATNTDAHAFGRNAQATGSSSTALGRDAVSAGLRSVSLGDSYASGTDSFAAAIANNTSSYGATGANSIAMGSLAKASGTFATSIGYGTQATAGNSTSVGRSSVASGSQSLALGMSSNASGEKATAIGSNAKAEIYGKLAYAAADFGSSSIYSQTGTYVLLSDTTDATAESLTTNRSTAAADNQVILPNNSAYGFTGTIIARENSAATNDFAVWEVKGGAVRAASAATTALGSYNINKISESTGAAAWAIAISADTTNGAIAFTVTGEASHSIRWVATINTTEVTY